VHTVFTSECHNKQFDWFATGVYKSFHDSGQLGSITRLLACSQEDLKEYQGLDLGPTFVHPNYRHNPINGDESASYNKPASVMHFTREANFTEDFILFIDADMILTRPIDPIALGAKKGTVVSEYVPYMIGTTNGAAQPAAVPLARRRPLRASLRADPMPTTTRARHRHGEELPRTRGRPARQVGRLVPHLPPRRPEEDRAALARVLRQGAHSECGTERHVQSARPVRRVVRRTQRVPRVWRALRAGPLCAKADDAYLMLRAHP
jgi:hypothetical protein